MGRFNENVSRIGETQNPSLLQSRNEVRTDVRIRPSHNLKVDVRVQQLRAQGVDGWSYLRTGVVVEAWENVRCAGDSRYAIRDKHSCHFKRRRKVNSAIIYTRQKVAV